MANKKSCASDIEALIQRHLNMWRFRRPAHRIAKQALRHADADLREARAALRWLREQRCYQPDGHVEQALVEIEQRACDDAERIRPWARGKAIHRARFTPLLVELSEKLRPRGVPKGERSEHARELQRLLAAHGLLISAPSIAQLLRNHRLRRSPR